MARNRPAPDDEMAQENSARTPTRNEWRPRRRSSPAKCMENCYRLQEPLQHCPVIGRDLDLVAHAEQDPAQKYTNGRRSSPAGVPEQCGITHDWLITPMDEQAECHQSSARRLFGPTCSDESSKVPHPPPQFHSLQFSFATPSGTLNFWHQIQISLYSERSVPAGITYSCAPSSFSSAANIDPWT